MKPNKNWVNGGIVALVNLRNSDQYQYRNIEITLEILQNPTRNFRMHAKTYKLTPKSILCSYTFLAVKIAEKMAELRTMNIYPI